MSPGYIHTVAVKSEGELLKSRTGLVVASDGASIRQQVIHALKMAYSESRELDIRDLNFVKDEQGLPSLDHRSMDDQRQPCSISHHGKFGAFAISTQR